MPQNSPFHDADYGCNPIGRCSWPPCPACPTKGDVQLPLPVPPRDMFPFKRVTTVVLSPGHGLAAGDWVVIKTPDRRWWRRLWCWVTFRSAPMVSYNASISDVEGSSFTFTRTEEL